MIHDYITEIAALLHNFKDDKISYNQAFMAITLMLSNRPSEEIRKLIYPNE